MPSAVLYEFEELSADLPRPPLAAMCALASSGVTLSARGWAQLSQENRWSLARAGAAQVVDPAEVRSLLHGSIVREVRLIPHVWAVPAQPHPDLVRALGPVRRLTDERWAALRPFERYVLTALSTNARLLWRAMKEILPELVMGAQNTPWIAAVGHATVRMRNDVLEHIRSTSFLEGRALVLARTAGVRSARRASETFDLRAEASVGVVELDWAAGSEPGVLLWQAHVSMWDGSFFPAASLSAAASAAVALCDIARELDPTAALSQAHVVEEPWLVGSDSQEPTAVYQANVPIAAMVARLSERPIARVPEPRAATASTPPAASAPERGLPTEARVVRLLVALIVALAVATVLLAGVVVVFALKR